MGSSEVEEDEQEIHCRSLETCTTKGLSLLTFHGSSCHMKTLRLHVDRHSITLLLMTVAVRGEGVEERHEEGRRK